MAEKEPVTNIASLTMTAEEAPEVGELILERQIPSDEALVTPMVVRFMDYLIQEGIVVEANRNRVGLCLEEAIRNAVIHGNKEDFKKMASVKLFLEDTQWSLQVDDDGEGFDLNDVPSPVQDEALWGEGGRGLSLMALYMDDPSTMFVPEGLRVLYHIEQRDGTDDHASGGRAEPLAVLAVLHEDRVPPPAHVVAAERQRVL